MEPMEVLFKAISILFNPVSLAFSALIFTLTMVIIILIYFNPGFRKFFQGTDEDFLESKAFDLEEAINLLDLGRLTSVEKKKVAESLKSVKIPLDNLLINL